MNEFSILILLIGALSSYRGINIFIPSYNKNLKNIELENKVLGEDNGGKSTEIAVLQEQVRNSEKLLENTNLEKKLVEQELAIKDLANKNNEIDKDLVKTNQKFDTKFDSTSSELKENSEKIGLLYGNSQSQGNFGEYSLDLVFEQANYTEGHNYFSQKSFSFVDSDGKSRTKRPDFVVPRPFKGDGVMNIVIDAKTPLADFKEWVNAKKSNEKRAVLDRAGREFY